MRERESKRSREIKRDIEREKEKQDYNAQPRTCLRRKREPKPVGLRSEAHVSLKVKRPRHQTREGEQSIDQAPLLDLTRASGPHFPSWSISRVRWVRGNIHLKITRGIFAREVWGGWGDEIKLIK